MTAHVKYTMTAYVICTTASTTGTEFCDDGAFPVLVPPSRISGLAQSSKDCVGSRVCIQAEGLQIRSKKSGCASVTSLHRYYRLIFRESVHEQFEGNRSFMSS